MQNPTNISDTFLPPENTGIIILAGGLGTRLGFSGPKGCFPLPNGKTLFETHLDKFGHLPLAVMTSPTNHEETKKALPDIPIFMQKEANGNGYALSYFLESGITFPGVDSLCIIQVDNPKAMAFRPKCDLDVATFVIENEEVGRLCDVNGHLKCVEYTESPPQDLIYANSGNFACSLDFAKRCAGKKLPPHTAVKQGKEKTEYFIFDNFKYASSYQLIVAPKESFFAPIKSPNDVF